MQMVRALVFVMAVPSLPMSAWECGGKLDYAAMPIVSANAVFEGAVAILGLGSGLRCNTYCV